MKKALTIALMTGLVAGALAVGPAQAKKAQSVTFYLHGTETIGEIDIINNFAVGYSKMDTAKPKDPVPKSVTGLFWKENFNDCAGMYGVPAWTGNVSGQIKGDMKLSLHTINRPAGAIEVEIWPDVTTMMCATNNLTEGSYPDPVASETVDLPPGHDATTVVFKNVSFKAVSSLLVQITPVGGPASTRILYDSPDFASSLKFSCTPTKGNSCT